MVSGDNAPLMRVRGQGEVFLAERAAEVFIVALEGDAITVNGNSLLAFEASLDWDIKRVQAGMTSGGLFNTVISGQGQVALNSQGTPMLLDCSRAPTYVDMQAAAAWSANLVPDVVSSMRFTSMMRGGCGEAAQFAFHGPGFVVVQPCEGARSRRTSTAAVAELAACSTAGRGDVGTSEDVV